MSEIDKAIEFTKKNLKMCEVIEQRHKTFEINVGPLATDIHKTILKCLEEKQKREWIPVSERLPDKDGFYLVQYPKDCSYKGMSVIYFYKGSDHFQGIHDSVEAWQPLPAPYKEAKP